MFWLPIAVAVSLAGATSFVIGKTLSRIGSKGTIRSVRQWQRGEAALFVFIWFLLSTVLIVSSVFVGEWTAIPTKKTESQRSALAPLNPLVPGSYLVTILDEDGEPMIGYRFDDDGEGSLRSTLKSTSKVLASDDGTAYVEIYHPRPTGWWQAVILMGWQERVEFHVP